MSKDVKILIVEGNLAESEYLKHILEQHEYRVTVEHNGNAALDAARTNSPRIVISDIALPETDGERSAIEKAQTANSLGSEELLGFMLEHAKDYSIFTTDAENRVTSWNAGAERFFGYSEAEILGQNGAILFTPEDRDNGAPKQELHTAVTKGRAEDERWHLRKDETRFWVSGIVKPHWDDAGQLRGFIKIGRDLTERKIAQDELRKAHNELEQRVEKRTAQLKKANEKLQSEINERKRAEQALIKSEKHFRRIVETAQEGVWMVDEQAKTSYVNDRMAEMLGYTVDEMLGRSMYDFMDDESRIEAERNFQKRRDGSKEQHDFCFRRKDGTDLWAFVSTNPIINDNNVFMGAVGLITDISERKSAAKLLQNNLSLLTSTFEATADGILVVDINNKILTFNEKFVEMWGIPKEAAREKNTAQMLACVSEQLKDLENFKRKLEKSLQQPEATDFSILELKDGRFYERFSLPQILEGKVVGRVLSYRDITERKRADEALHASERRFRELVEILPIAVYTCDLSGAIEGYNKSAVELWGRTPKRMDIADSFCGSYKIYNVDGVYMPHAECPMAQVLRTGNPISNEEIVVERFDGTRRTAMVNILPRRDGQGNMTGAINCLVDITNRKQAEDALRQSEANLAAAQQITHLGSWELEILDLEDANKNPVHCSDEVYRIFGYEPGQIKVTGEVLLRFS
ncbi:MAG: PAS domain S-box protein [Acidobacteria bacterium]|nr:PAS domain S-box protein [Acidobacteriota bacterium]